MTSKDKGRQSWAGSVLLLSLPAGVSPHGLLTAEVAHSLVWHRSSLCSSYTCHAVCFFFKGVVCFVFVTTGRAPTDVLD